MVQPRRHETANFQHRSWNIVDQTFRSPKELSAWRILNYTRLDEANISRFIGTLISTCKKLSMVNHLTLTASD